MADDVNGTHGASRFRAPCWERYDGSAGLVTRSIDPQVGARSRDMAAFLTSLLWHVNKVSLNISQRMEQFAKS